MMLDDTNSTLNCVSSSEATFDWRKNEAKEQSVDALQEENTTVLDRPNAFRVYDKVLEKQRYVPRQWTQKDFEAALPERFRAERSANIAGRNIGFQAKEGEESKLRKDKEQVAPSSENTLSTLGRTASVHPRRKSDTNKKISNLKAAYKTVDNEVSEQLSSANNDLERCKESQAKVILLNPECQDTKDNNVECELPAETTQNCQNTLTSFLNACLQCLLNIEPFVQVLSNASSACRSCSSFDIGKLKDLLNTVPSFDKSRPKNLSNLYTQDVFAKFYNEMSTQGKISDEVLEILLETLSKEMTDHENQRSLFQGKFCHATTCDKCATVVREYESFMFLNPTSPPPSSSQDNTMEINFLSRADGHWSITSDDITVSSGMVVLDLKEQLLSYPEFYTCSCDTSSIQIGEVKNSRFEQLFDDMQDISTLPTSNLFAFHVKNFQCELNENTSKPENCTGSESRCRGFADMSYHLYFNCGLCLNDGTQVGLLMHRSCGGMVCQDCLDEISRSNQGWKLCPCPICERPINLEKELCTAKITGAETERLNDIHPDVVCGIMFRIDRPCKGGAELFASPLLVCLPYEATGYQLYRCIGYLLPKALPMKDKTSFTLHKVDKSGLGCANCSVANCTGCLVRIDDNITVTPDTYLAVHFDDLAEESKKDFGIKTYRIPQLSKTQALFDGILRSCVDASSSKQSLCPKCFHISKATSSITEFPQILVVHLNEHYASKGLPANMTVADIARFFILERGNVPQGDVEQGLTYQLTATVLGHESSMTSTYKACVPGFSDDKWLIYDDFHVNEIHPTLLHLTSDSVLFYEPVIEPSPTESPITELRLPTTSDRDEEVNGRDDSNCLGYDIYGRDVNNVKRLDTITEDKATKNYPTKSSDSGKPKKQAIPKSYNRWFDPGECYLRKDFELDLNRRFPESDVYGSQLSLGEIRRESLVWGSIPATVLDDIDNISPIATTNVWKSESRLVRETKKLVKAVKKEDAYGIVCSLKRGADPCLLVNDVSALHLAVGIKSDQRRSMVAYLLKYSNDANIPTADGTTPIHVAAAWGHQDALELLLAHGGDPFETTDLEGNCALDLAVKDCASYLQSVYNRQRNSTRFLEHSTSSHVSLPNKLNTLEDDLIKLEDKRLEDIVRSNVGLPSFVEENTNSASIRRRWLQRLRSFRERSSGILRNLRKMSNRRRRSRIGVMVNEAPGDTREV